MTNEASLKCDHEEADDRIMFHINQSVKEDRFEKIIIASPDTDVFVCSVKHFNRWIFSDMKELWVISGRSGTTIALPVHKLPDKLESDVIDILPAVHALTGCDTTSKIETKSSALKIASQNDFSELVSFGKINLDDGMLLIAERYLVQCICKDESVKTFDQLRNNIYYQKSQLWRNFHQLRLV